MYFRIIAIALIVTIANLSFINRASSQAIEVRRNLIKVKKIKIEGNTVFSDSEFQKIFTPIKNKSITLEQLLKIKNKVTQFYHQRGYITSNTFLPSQTSIDGVLKVRVIEGSLNTVEVEGLSNLNERYIKARLPKPNRPLKVENLTKALEKLKKDPLIKEIDAQLKVLNGGKNLLSLKIEENKPIQTELNFVNTYSPTIGNLGGSATIVHQNLSRFGDRASINYIKTEGLDRYGIDYSIPFNSSGGRIAFDYSNADSEIIEEVISAYDIQADFEAYKLSIRQPIIDNQTEELVFSLALEKLRSETFVAEDISFAFVDGLENGVSRITPLRLAQEYTRRGNSSLIAAKSQFNLGLNILNITKNETGIDADFWSWLGSVQ